MAGLRAGRSGIRILAGTRDCSLLRNAQTGAGAHRWAPAFLPCWGVKLTTLFHPVSRLRMIGAVPLHPPYTYMTWKGTFSLSFLIFTCFSFCSIYRSLYLPLPLIRVGRDSSVGIATRYGLEGPGIESRWGRDFPHLSRLALGPTHLPIQSVPGVSQG